MWPLKQKYPSAEGVLRTEKLNAMATTAFCDIASISSMPSKVSTEEGLGDLNRHLTCVVETMRENKGTLADFVGDAVLAYWLAEEHPDHASLACTFARSLQTRLHSLYESFSIQLSPRICIHTGHVALVSLDHGKYRSTTPMGSTVNLASRLGGLCSQYKVSTIVTADVLAQAGLIPGTTPLGSVQVKGKTDPVALYTI